MKYFVQETVGGWRQVAIFEGSYDECLEYRNSNCFHGNWAIVSELEYEVDYL